MAIDFAAWMGETGDLQPPNAAGRAVAAWRRIQDKPTELSFIRPDRTTVAAQTVRIEFDDSAATAQSDAGQTGRRTLTIFGVRDHPTVADTLLDVGYTVRAGGRVYTITNVIETIGEIQAEAEALS